jgi:hypothetical protein
MSEPFFSGIREIGTLFFCFDAYSSREPGSSGLKALQIARA